MDDRESSYENVERLRHTMSHVMVINCFGSGLTLHISLTSDCQSVVQRLYRKTQGMPRGSATTTLQVATLTKYNSKPQYALEIPRRIEENENLRPALSVVLAP